MKWVTIKVDNMNRLLTVGICIILLVLITSGCINEENNNEQPYNESNFIPYIREDNTSLYARIYSVGLNKIVYQASTYLTNSSVHAIWVMNYDGSNKTVVYSNDTIDNDFTPPKFSYDGKQILFASRYKNNETDLVESSIDILKINGTEWNTNCSQEQIYRINVTNEGFLKEADFNQDSSKIVYQQGFGDRTDIWTMDSDGTNHTKLTTNIEEMDRKPTFSSDGSKIAWLRFHRDISRNRIWLMNTDGSNKKCLTPDNWDYDYPTFTPNGKILFRSTRVSPHSNKKGSSNIWMMDADGSNRTLIIPETFGGIFFNTGPAISPDNKMIIFSHGLMSKTGLYYVKDPDGDGIWEDSDGDGVADVCDGAPNDPNAGYIKGNDLDFIPTNGMVSSIILVVIVAIFSKKKY